jgi:hypothetical protein
MTRRTLTEELQSMLREQALDAPQPDRVITVVLQQCGAATQPAGPSVTGWIRRIRRPSRLMVAGIAVAVCVLGVIGIINVQRSGNGSSRSSASSSSGGASLGVTNGAASPAAGAGGTAARPAPQRNPPAAAAEPALTNVCPEAEHRSVVELTLGGSRRWVVLGNCFTPGGVPTGGYLDVYPAQGEQAAPAALHVFTLAQKVSPDTAIVVVGGDLEVRASEWRPSPPGSVPAARVGAAFDYRIRFSAGTFRILSQTLFAAPCAPNDVRVGITAPSAPEPRTVPHKVIQVVNTSALPCALQGTPTVTLTDRSGRSASAEQTLRGPAGGSASASAPLVVLAPGAVASAIIEPTTAASCAGRDTVAVTEAAGPLGAATSDWGACSAAVHPFFGGSDGNG